MVRKPAVAGQFYPADKKSLENEMRAMVRPVPSPRKVVGLMAPHAGYAYSGACAGLGYSRVRLTATVIILGVNHRGQGAPLALDGHGYWQTPLGNVALDSELRSRLCAGSRLFAVDSDAGRLEHSLEVQVPFIQYVSPGSRILPITVAVDRLEDLLAAGHEIAALFKENDDIMMIASSDMSHYIPAASARHLDALAIGRMLQLDAAGLHRVVGENRISMCGVAPAVIMLTAAREAGANSAELLCYTNSGEVSGNFNEVVGYASLVVY